METGDFDTLDQVYKQILADDIDIDVKMNYEAERQHLRLENELDIRNFINSVMHNDVYKTIRKSIKTLNDKQEQAENAGINLDP